MNSIEVSSFDQWWWLEVKTAVPECIYYFGPFFSEQEAEISQYGYIEDLCKEEAHGITVEIKKMNPKELTIEITNE